MRGVPLIVEAGLGLGKTVTWILRNINPEIDYLRSGARVAREILVVLAIYCRKTHQKFPFPTIDSRGNSPFTPPLRPPLRDWPNVN